MTDYPNLATRRLLRKENRQAYPRPRADDSPAFAVVTLCALGAVCCGVVAGMGIGM